MIAEPDLLHVKSVAIILAAGSSSRMGESKQMLKVNNESLLRKTIRTTIDAAVDHVVVVLGSGEAEHRKEFVDFPVSPVFNREWENGMGSSLKCGVQFVNGKFPSCEIILVTVCDQPLLTSEHLAKLIFAFHSDKNPIVASFYSESLGVPALFHRSMFESLLRIDDSHGAKKVINDHRALAGRVDFPRGEIDLDTPADWEKFNSAH